MDETYELFHHGIKGQKWGIRRYQNKDGTWTAEGKKKKNAARSKVATSNAKTNNKGLKTKKSKKVQESALKKKVRGMSDEELIKANERLRMEREYLQTRKTINELAPDQVSKGKKVADHIINKIILPAVTDAAKQTLTDALKKQGQKMMESMIKSKDKESK